MVSALERAPGEHKEKDKKKEGEKVKEEEERLWEQEKIEKRSLTVSLQVISVMKVLVEVQIYILFK